MKAYTLDLRERVVRLVHRGGTRAEAAQRFSLGLRSVYRYLAAAKADTLAPKTTWGGWRKLDPGKLAAYVRQHPDATLHELKATFGVSHNADGDFLCETDTVWIDIDLNDLGLFWPVIETIARQRRERIETRAKGKNDIGFRDQFHCGFGAIVTERTGEQTM